MYRAQCCGSEIIRLASRGTDAACGDTCTRVGIEDDLERTDIRAARTERERPREACTRRSRRYGGLRRLKNTPNSGVLPAIKFKNGNTTHAEAFRKIYFLLYRLRIGPYHVAEREIRIVCVGEGRCGKCGRKSRHLRRSQGDRGGGYRRVAERHLSPWSAVRINIVLLCHRHRIPGIERPEYFVHVLRSCIHRHIVLVAVGGDAYHELVLRDVLRHEAHHFFYPCGVPDWRVELRARRVLRRKLLVDALLVVHHEAYTVAVFIYLDQIIRVDGRISGWRRAIVPVGDRCARFDGAHHPLLGQAHREPFEEEREIIARLGLLAFKIDINAVKTFFLDEGGDVIFERDATLCIAQKCMYKLAVARHDRRDKADIIFLRLCAERKPRLRVERAVVEKGPVGFERVDERIDLGQGRHMGKHIGGPRRRSPVRYPTRNLEGPVHCGISRYGREPRQRRGEEKYGNKKIAQRLHISVDALV